MSLQPVQQQRGFRRWKPLFPHLCVEEAAAEGSVCSCYTLENPPNNTFAYLLDVCVALPQRAQG